MKRDNKKVIYWLFTGCALIFIMVVVGGITRLTHSGLSMPDYKLISGTIPPINDQQWQEAFKFPNTFDIKNIGKKNFITNVFDRFDVQDVSWAHEIYNT